MSVFYAFERYTSHFALSKADKTVKIIQEIAKLPPELRADSNEQISKVTSAVTGSLIKIASTTDFSITIHPKFQKFIAAIIPWLLMLILAPLVGGDDLEALVFGLIFCGALFGVIGIFIPPEDPNWVNFWLYPIVHFVVVLFFLVRNDNKKRHNEISS